MERMRLRWLSQGEVSLIPTVVQHRPFRYVDSIDGGLSLCWRTAIPGQHPNIIPGVEATEEDFLRILSNRISGDETLDVAISAAYQMGPVERDGVQSLLEIDPSNTGQSYVIFSAAILPWHVEDAHIVSRDDHPGVFSDLIRLTSIEDPGYEPLTSERARRFAERIRSDAARKEYQESLDRAKRLLEATLDMGQLEEFRRISRFRVRASDGHTYLVMYGSHGNVLRITGEEDDIVADKAYCIVSTDAIPVYDQMLGQKLLLETDLEAFHRIANVRDISVVVPTPGVQEGV